MFSKKKNLHKELEKIRGIIPKQYNHLEALDYLDDEDVQQFFSITTRGDGKTYNYLLALAILNISLDFCTCLIVRHDQLRSPALMQLEDIYRDQDALDYKKFNVISTPNIIECYYNGKPAFLIVDLNDADDLKHYRSVLKKANLFLYDEFLAIGGEYTSNEYKKFRYIFETADNGTPVTSGMKYTNNLRKAIFLGNPVDFGSEFLSVYNLYHKLETQPINTVKKYGTYVLERRRNDNARDNANTKMFPDAENESVTGIFNVNDWQIKEHDAATIPIICKLEQNYLYIFPENTPVLSIKAIAEKYEFNTNLCDNSESSTFCDSKYYREKFYKHYSRNEFYFENQYSKDIILNEYDTLNINKIINNSKVDNNDSSNIDQKIEQINFKKLKTDITNSYFYN
ncbi:MAG: hypothetical protein J6574_03930 [Gilliamella sp.]|nr:hypothetical protein [Gilliamella sp.]